MLNKKDAISKAESNVFLIFDWLYFILIYFIYFAYILYVILMLNDTCSKLNTCVKEPVKGPCLVSSKMQYIIYLVKTNPIISSESLIVWGETYSSECFHFQEPCV